jgi:hypothetical protein
MKNSESVYATEIIRIWFKDYKLKKDHWLRSQIISSSLTFYPGICVGHVILKAQFPHPCRFDSRQRLFLLFLIRENYPTSLRTVSGSIRVPARDWNKERKGTLGLRQPLKLESHHMNSNVLVRHKINNWIKPQSMPELAL